MGVCSSVSWECVVVAGRMTRLLTPAALASSDGIIASGLPPGKSFLDFVEFVLQGVHPGTAGDDKSQPT